MNSSRGFCGRAGRALTGLVVKGLDAVGGGCAAWVGLYAGGRAGLALTALVLKGLDPVDRACPAWMGLYPVDRVLALLWIFWCVFWRHARFWKAERSRVDGISMVRIVSPFWNVAPKDCFQL